MLSAKLGQRGDTIIEVMIALSILALAFSISYATASHALQISQNAQEHGQALQIIDSQLELARGDINDPQLFLDDGNYFCLGMSGSHIITSTNRFSDPANAPDFCHQYLNGDVYYTVYVLYDKNADSADVDQDNFSFSVTWPGIGDLGRQQEQVNYKLHEASTDGS